MLSAGVAMTTQRTDAEKALAWLVDARTDPSSITVATFMAGIHDGSNFGDHPRNPLAFSSCYRLLARYPEWRTRLPEMAVVSPAWAALVAAWPGIEASYRRDEDHSWGRDPSDTARLIRDALEGVRS